MKVLTAGLLLAGAAFCDVVTDWNSILCNTIRNEGAHVQSRYAAIAHLAMFDAVNSITREYRPYVASVRAPWGASAEAAAAVAGYRVLVTYYPNSATTLNVEREKSLAALPDGPGKLAGIAVGEEAAATLLARRANDGASTQVPYSPPIGVGYWQTTPPAHASAVAVQWGKMVPFGMASASQFRPGPPPALNSRVYTRDYKEVKAMGGVDSDARPADRTNLARYMALTSPTQVLNHIALQLSASEGLTLSENARMFALMNMAIADSAIALFEAKYFYNFWRPITAIRAGDTDGNARTEADPGFTTLINAPAYPSYPSGFGALSNGGRYVLEHFFGRRGHTLSLAANPNVPNMELRYTNLQKLMDDISDSRVYGGIHFRFEQDEAETLGERVATYVLRRQLRPVCSGIACVDEQ